MKNSGLERRIRSNSIDPLKKSVTTEIVAINTKQYLEIADQVVQMGYINKLGNTEGNADVNWLRSDFIEIVPGSIISVSVVGHNAVGSVCFYSEAKALLGVYGGVVDGALFVSEITAPPLTKYLRVSFGNPLYLPGASDKSNSVRIEVIDIDRIKKIEEQVSNLKAPDIPFIYKAPRKLQLSPTDKILLYGDSISSEDYPWYKEAMEECTGATVWNGGFSGYNSAMLAQNAQLNRIWNYGARLVIAMVGGNDTGSVGSIGTFSGAVEGEPVVSETSLSGDYNGSYYIQAVSHIIRKFNAQYGNLRTRAGLTGSESEAEKTAKIDALLKPVLVFATPLPQKRNNNSDAFSIQENWMRKRAAVIECCEKYKVHCVDLTMIPFDMEQEPFWVSPTDRFTNNGINTMDGLHLNKYGSRITSEFVCADIGI